MDFASMATGDQSFTGTTGDGVFIGAAGVDTVTTNTGTDVILTSAGDDIITIDGSTVLRRLMVGLGQTVWRSLMVKQYFD